MIYVFTLSAIPPRFDTICDTLETITKQQARPEAVLLYIPKRFRRFPDYRGELPKVPKGVEVRVVDEDIGPATKVLYAAMEYQNDKVDIIYGDDDRFYPPDLTKALLEARKERPDEAIVSAGFDLAQIGYPSGSLQPRAVASRRKGRDWTYRVNRIAQQLGLGPRIPNDLRPSRAMFKKSGYVDIAEGYGCVALAPSYFKADDLNVPDEAWFVDDIYLSGLLALRGVPIWLTAKARLHYQDEYHANPLATATINGLGREALNRRCADYMSARFGIWTQGQ